VNFNLGSIRLWYVNSEAYEIGGAATRHMMYIEGRPRSWLTQINVRAGGALGSSLCKSTMRHHTLAHCWFSTVRDPAQPALGKRASKLIDIISASETIVFNCDFTLLRDRASGGLGGSPDGAIYFRRRETSIHGCDEPPSSDKSYQPPSTSILPYDGHAMGSWPNSVETYSDPAFWTAVRQLPITDERNEYTFKHYVAWCTFTWIEETTHRRPPFRDDGVATHANYITEGLIVVVAAPPNWIDRAVTFFANNRYDGWPTAGPFPDSTGPDPFINIDEVGATAVQLVPGVFTYDDPQKTRPVYDQSPVPAGWTFPKPDGPRAVRFLGGDVGPHTVTDYPEAGGPKVELPDWFRLCATETA
jgi:hypothetical protein